MMTIFHIKKLLLPKLNKVYQSFVCKILTETFDIARAAAGDDEILVLKYK